MSKQTPFSDFFSQNDFTKALENYKTVPFDLQTFLETQRKNIQAISEVQQVAVENLQAIAQRQSQIFSQIVEDNSKIAQGFMAEGTPEEKIAKNADLFKGLYERSVKNLNELADMINSTSQETSKIINKRVSASMNEIKQSVDKTSSVKKAA
jgi:phasin family protein